ncbi:protein SEC13 homolog [Varroa jacobsoni]|uniref:Protein SEC13 homolog n=1 Tax=Varroa destructor TaxID=109461 RepID=A0A7M7KAD2_VARDE|nr:protein SEC13 homolog [Varroa destructor]XP_022690298.1 protein SEC13 homolog [Varroa jacobsoni]
MTTVVNTVDTSHEDMIHDCQMDFFGTRLATCSSDMSVKVFDLRGGNQKLVADLRGHEGPVWQISWAHPMFGSLLASCSYDRRVIIWRENAGQWTQWHEFKSHDSSVNAVQFAPYECGLMFAAASSDGSVSILSSGNNGATWDLSKITGAHLMGVNSVSWAPYVAPCSLFDNVDHQIGDANSDHQNGGAPGRPYMRLVTGGSDNLVKIWKYSEDQSSWVEEQSLEAHQDWVRDVAWCPSAAFSNCSMIASCSQDRTVIIWTSNDGNKTWKGQVLNTFDDVIWHVSWSLNGDMLAVSGGDNKITLWKCSPDHRWICISEDGGRKIRGQTPHPADRTL